MTSSSWLADGGIHPLAAVLQFVALVDQQGGVAAVVHDQLRALAARVAQRLVGAPPVVFERLALPGEHRHAGGGNGGGGVILGGENIAARPADRRAQVDQRLDQHRRLDGHVQRPGDPHALQRLRGGVLSADRHQAGHLVLGDGDLLAAPIGQAQVGHFVIAAYYWMRAGNRCAHAVFFLLSSTNLDMLIL